MYIVVGLLCGIQACLWYAPVGTRIYATEAQCLHDIANGDDSDLVRFRNGDDLYSALKCRRTTQRRME